MEMEGNVSEIKFRELKIVRAKNGYMAIPDAGGTYSVFTPTETMVVTDIAGLVDIVQDWATAVEAETVKRNVMPGSTTYLRPAVETGAAPTVEGLVGKYPWRHAVKLREWNAAEPTGAPDAG